MRRSRLLPSVLAMGVVWNIIAGVPFRFGSAAGAHKNTCGCCWPGSCVNACGKVSSKSKHTNDVEETQIVEDKERRRWRNSLLWTSSQWDEVAVVIRKSVSQVCVGTH